MRPNLLDFTLDGQVIINMPNYKEISFLENFGFSPIESVEQEVAQADSPVRAAFLQRYIKAFQDTYTSPPRSYVKELEDEDIPEFSSLDEQSIRIRNIRLLHTSAWYMMGHMSAEIKAVKRHLQELDGQESAVENLEKVIRLISASKTPNEACNRLQKHLEIGYIKANYIINLPLSKLTTSTAISIAIEREDYQKRLEFLRKFKPSGMR